MPYVGGGDGGGGGGAGHDLEIFVYITGDRPNPLLTQERKLVRGGWRYPQTDTCGAAVI